MQAMKRALVCATLMTATAAFAQHPPAEKSTPIADVSVMYSVEHTKMIGTDSAWLQGASGEFEFTLAETWAEAVVQLRAKEFHVLLLDLSLPDSSGRETFVRARKEAPALPILVLTGQANESVGLEAVLLPTWFDVDDVASCRRIVRRWQSTAGVRRAENSPSP